MSESKKILVVTGALSCGGITSFLIPLVNCLAESGHAVSLAYTKDEGEFDARISLSVRRICYEKPSRRKWLIHCCRRLRILDFFAIRFRNKKKTKAISAIQRLGYCMAEITALNEALLEPYDVAISASEFYCNALVAKKITARRKIGWVHPDVSALKIDCRAAASILEKLDAVAAVSEIGVRSLSKKFPKYSSKFHYIENILDVEWVKKRSEELVADMQVPAECRKIVSVCRLDNSAKRIDRALCIAKKLRAEGFSYRWFIIGDGPDMPMLSALIKKMDLSESVFLLGEKNNPYPYMKHADIFVLTSQYEGKPVVVEEAKLLRVPILSTEYGAAGEQIPEEFGAIVANIDGVLEEEFARYIMDSGWLSAIRKTIAMQPEYSATSIEKVLSLL